MFSASFTTILASWSPNLAVFVAVIVSPVTWTSAPVLAQFPVAEKSFPLGKPDTLTLFTLFLSSLTLSVGLNVDPLNTTNE